MSRKHIAILGAMPEEIGEIKNHLLNKKELDFGDLKLINGDWIDKETNTIYTVSTAWSGWGKVSSARAATRIISLASKQNPINLLIFTGVAGAAKKTLNQWDIVIPSSLMQYDMDARPFYEKFVIPAISEDKIIINEKLLNWANNTLKKNCKKLSKFGEIKIGTVATGDKFIEDEKVLESISNEIPNLLAVEMEGASVAQVSFQEKIPCIVIRTISDSADSNAALSFEEFLNIYKYESWNLIETLLKNFKEISN